MTLADYMRARIHMDAEALTVPVELLNDVLAENERLRTALEQIVKDKSVLPHYEIARIALRKAE